MNVIPFKINVSHQTAGPSGFSWYPVRLDRPGDVKIRNIPQEREWKLENSRVEKVCELFSHKNFFFKFLGIILKCLFFFILKIMVI